MSKLLERTRAQRRPQRLREKTISEQTTLERYGDAMGELVDIKEIIVSEVGKIKPATEPISRTKSAGVDQLFPAFDRLHDLIQTLPAILEEVGNDPDVIRDVRRAYSKYTLEPSMNELKRRELIDESRKEAFFTVFNECLEKPEPNTVKEIPPKLSEFFGDESIWNKVTVHCRDIFTSRFGQNIISEPLAWAVSNQLWDIQLATMPYEDKLGTYSVIKFDGDETPLVREMLRRYPESHLTNLSLKNWSAVRDTNRLVDLSPDIIQHFDQKIFDHILTKAKEIIRLGSPSQARFFINDLYFFPKAEVIAQLVQLSVFGLVDEAHAANITLTDLARRNDWQTMLENLLETYPGMTIVAKDLANFEFDEKCNYPISPALREKLASAIGYKYHYDLRLDATNSKPAEYWVMAAQQEGYITKEEKEELHQAIYLIPYLERIQRLQRRKISGGQDNPFIRQIQSTISNYLIRNSIIGQPGNSANTDAGRTFAANLKNLAMLASAIRRHKGSYDKIVFLTAYEVVRAVENLESFTIKEILEEEPEDQRPILLLTALEKILEHPSVTPEMAPACIAILLHCFPAENRQKLDKVLAFFIETFSSDNDENIAEKALNTAIRLDILRRILGLGDMDAAVRGVLEPNNLYIREEAQIVYILAFVQRAAELEKERFAATPILSEVPKRIEFPRVELEGSFIDPLGDIQPTMGIELDTQVAGFRFSNPRFPISFPSEQAALLKQTGIEIDEHGGRTSIDQGIYELALPPALTPGGIFPVYDEVVRAGWLNTLNFNPIGKNPVTYQIGTRIHVTFGDAPMYDEIRGANLRIPPELKMATHAAETTGYALPADEWVMEPFAQALHKLVIENKETAQKMLAEALKDPLYLFWLQRENIPSSLWEQLIIFYDNPRGDLEPVDERSLEQRMQTPGYSRDPVGRLYQTRAAHNRDPFLSRLYLHDLSTSWICFSELARIRQAQDDHNDLSEPLYVKYQDQLTTTPWEKLDEESLKIIQQELPSNEINEHLNHYRTIASTGALKLATASHAIGKRFNLQYDTQWNSHTNPKHDLMDGAYTHNDLFVQNRTHYPKAWDDTIFRQADPSGAFRERVKIALLARLSHPNIIESLLGPESRHAGNYLTELTAGEKSFRSPAHLMQETLAEIGQKLEIAQQDVYRAFKKELSQVVMDDPESVESFTQRWRTKRAERNGFADPRDFVLECRKRANISL